MEFKKLKNYLSENKMLDDEMLVNFKNRQFSIFKRIYDSVASLFTNKNREHFLSVADSKLYIFGAKGFFEPSSVIDKTKKVIDFADITAVTKKDVQLNNIRSLKFTIETKDDKITGIIDNLDTRKVFNKIAEKIGK